MKIKTQKILVIILISFTLLLLLAGIWLWIRVFKSSPENIVNRIHWASGGTVGFVVILGALSFPISKMLDNIVKDEEAQEAAIDTDEKDDIDDCSDNDDKSATN